MGGTPSDIPMPKLSDSMEQGLVLQWLIGDGQSVNAGDELVEIETDKATMSYHAEAAGILEIVVPAGTSVAVGEVIARLGVATAVGTPVGSDVTSESEPTSAPEPLPVDAAPPPEASRTAPDGGRRGGQHRSATPLARRLADSYGITLEALTGTGPGGRITKSDVLSATGTPEPAAVPEQNGGSSVELTRIQALIARRMAESQATIPHFQVQTEVAATRLLALRAELTALDDGQPVPSLNDIIVRASALALREHPHANGTYRNDRYELHDRINIGIAVATEGALVVPTILNADTKTIHQIAADTRRLAGRVRSATITPSELASATFTVSNLGMYGMTAITPVINPPQAAILGVGAIRHTLARDGDQIVDQPLLTLTLSCDHRILYGADAARFLSHIKTLLEQPLRLLL